MRVSHDGRLNEKCLIMTEPLYLEVLPDELKLMVLVYLGELNQISRDGDAMVRAFFPPHRIWYSVSLNVPMCACPWCLKIKKRMDEYEEEERKYREQQARVKAERRRLGTKSVKRLLDVG